MNSPLGCFVFPSIGGFLCLPFPALPVGIQVSSTLLFVQVFMLGRFLNPNTVQQNCIYQGLADLIP